MSILRLARAETTRLEFGEGDWLEVRSDISKRDFNNLIKKMPQDISSDGKVTPGQATDLGVALFDTLVVGWSLEGVEPTVDNYLGLGREAGDAVDAELGKHFESLTPTREEQTKSKRGK